MELTPQQLKKINRLDKFIADKDLATVEEFSNLEDKVDAIAEKVDTIAESTASSIAQVSEELKKKLSEELVYEIDEQKIVDSVLAKVPPPKNGENYVLTDKDKKDIAKSIDVPVVEKVIEKTVVKEPTYTRVENFVENKDTGEQIIDKINVDESPKLIKRDKVEGLDLELNRLDNTTRVIGANRNLWQLLDVNISNPTAGQNLEWNGTQWVNSTDDTGSINGTIASGQVAFGTGVNTIGGSNNFTWDGYSINLPLLGADYSTLYRSSILTVDSVGHVTAPSGNIYHELVGGGLQSDFGFGFNADYGIYLGVNSTEPGSIYHDESDYFGQGAKTIVHIAQSGDFAFIGQNPSTGVTEPATVSIPNGTLSTFNLSSIGGTFEVQTGGDDYNKISASTQGKMIFTAGNSDTGNGSEATFTMTDGLNFTGVKANSWGYHISVDDEQSGLDITTTNNQGQGDIIGWGYFLSHVSFTAQHPSNTGNPETVVWQKANNYLSIEVDGNLYDGQGSNRWGRNIKLIAEGNNNGGSGGDIILTPGTGDTAQPVGNVIISTLTSNGFLKTSGGTGTISVDTTSYQPLDATLTSLAAISGVQGDLIYASGTDTWTRLAKDTNATRYLSNTGTTNNPAWAQINMTNGVTGTLPVANGGTGAATFTNNRLLTGNGTSALVDEANATFDGTTLTIVGVQSLKQTTTNATILGDTTGNTRGSRAVDLQSYRASVTQIASGSESTTVGLRNTASGANSGAFGWQNTAVNLNDNAFGYNNTSSGAYSTTVGGSNTASGYVSTASGYHSTASGSYSTAMGREAKASGNYSVAIGAVTSYLADDMGAYAANSVAIGYNTRVQSSATNSVAIGAAVNNSTANSAEVGASNTEKLRISSAGANLITAAGVFAVNGTALPTFSNTGTFTNKRITPRVGTTTSSGTPTINTDNVDTYILTAQAANITSMTTNLSGTPTSDQKFSLIITGTGTFDITWGTGFESGNITLPTTGAITTTRTRFGFAYNSTTSKWRIESVS